VREKNKWKIIMLPEYDYKKMFSEGLAKVMKK